MCMKIGRYVSVIVRNEVLDIGTWVGKLVGTVCKKVGRYVAK